MTATTELAERPNRLDELVWAITGCSVTDAQRATRAPLEAIDADLALDVLANALVRLGHVPVAVS
jgi:hypothetical protein